MGPAVEPQGRGKHSSMSWWSGLRLTHCSGPRLEVCAIAAEVARLYAALAEALAACWKREGIACEASCSFSGRADCS